MDQQLIVPLETLIQQARTLKNPLWDYVQTIERRAKRRHSAGKYASAWEARDIATRRVAWAITDPEALATVAYYLGPKAIEIGAGTGYWAMLLSQLGVQMTCYDTNWRAANSRHEARPYWDYARRFYLVRDGGVEHAGDDPTASLFLCWPPYANRMAAEALRIYQEAGGQRVVYIGEGESGCTGDDRFHEQLAEDWERVTRPSISEWEPDYFPIAQWDGIHDSIYVYNRKEQTR